MQKPELIKKVAEETGQPVKTVTTVLNCFFNRLFEFSDTPEGISIQNIGKFLVVKDAAKTINSTLLKNGPKYVPPKKRLVFRAAKALKQEI